MASSLRAEIMDGSIAGATPPAMPVTQQQQQQTVESKRPSPPSTNITCGGQAAGHITSGGRAAQSTTLHT